MNFPRPYTPINYVIEIDKGDEIGLQPNKRPISTVNVDKNSKKRNNCNC